MSAAVEDAGLVTCAAPQVTDRNWFSDRTGMQFRAPAGEGGVWLIRSRPQNHNHDVFLRVWTTTPAPPDAGEPLAVAWVLAVALTGPRDRQKPGHAK